MPLRLRPLYLLFVSLLLSVGVGEISAVAADSPLPSALKPPPAKRIGSVIYYHAQARKLGREGRVELEFSIGANGKATHVAVLLADDAALTPDARALLDAVVFDVPSDWRTSGMESKRYRLGMVYCLPPSGQTQEFPDAVSTMIITAERIRGAPVRNPIHPGAWGRCAQAS